MNEQSPLLDTGTTPVNPEATPEAPVSGPMSVTAHLQAVRNTLLWSVRDDGDHLWQARWLAQTCGPRLAIVADRVDPDVAELILQAFDRLEPVDGLAWTERMEPVLAVVALLGDALDRCDPAPPSLRPRVLLVSGGTEASGQTDELVAAETTRAPRGRGRKRSHRPAARVEAPPCRRPTPPNLAPAVFGAPEDTGRALASVSGADPDLVARLAGHGVETLANLLRTLPAGAEPLTLADPLAELPENGSQVALRGQVVVRWRSLGPHGQSGHLHMKWGEHTVRCSWLEGTPHGAAYTMPGDELVLAGELRLVDGGLVLEHALPWKADGKDRIWRPSYGLEGIADRELWTLLHGPLGTSLPRLIEPVPHEVLRSARVLGLAEAYRDIHRPLGKGDRGRSRLAFDEFFTYRLAQSAEKVLRPKGIAHTLGHRLLGQLCVQHGIQLDDEQERAFDDLRRDLGKPVAMVRLLQGDVGSGKALVALMSAVMVAEGRSQVLFLAPDALAAEHRFMFAEPLLRSVGLVPHLLEKEPSKAQLDALRRGEAHIIFASHALLRREQGLPEFKRLGLVVVEERKSFGTVTQADLGQGKHHPDLLVVTSVPIPSSLVFTLFATADLSVLPPSQASRVSTQVLPPDHRQRAFEVIRETLAAGQQAYIVFPLSRGVDVVDRPRGTSLANALAKEALDGARVALYHGTMSREERFRIFDDFRHQRIDVLLATTTIEDAPEVVNATAMVVENADRFDLVRLHRLRGHVSQGRGEGQCVLVLSEEPDPRGKAIVNLVASEQDGFAIAEQDRLERGDDELLGGRVSELPVFQFGDPLRDRDLFIRARKAAIQVLVKDPQLRQRAHRSLAREIPGLADQIEAKGVSEGGAGRKRRRRRRRSGRR